MVGQTRATLDPVAEAAALQVGVALDTKVALARSETRARSSQSPLHSRVRETVRKLLGASEGGGRSSFRFYAAIRRLEGRFRQAPRIGEAAVPADEPVRLSQDPSLAFRATALSQVEDGGDGGPARVSVSFFGAFGPHGPLPLHFTEYAYERRRHHGDRAFIGFFDIFHHRLLSLLYRAWADAQPTVSHDRPEDDYFARRLGALIGIKRSAAELSQVDYGCLFTAGHFVGRTRHAEGLKKVLRACLQVDVEIEEFVGEWLRLPDDACWRLPRGNRGAVTCPGVLGETTRVGTEVWDQQASFRVILGPLGFSDYQRFLPGGSRLPRLLELIERYVGPELHWELRLVLREPERRSAVLGVEGVVGMTAHLAGGDGVVSQHHEDLVLDPRKLPAH
jgi:type VI secretion system protein ImpH